MKEVKISKKRHVAKAITWRIIGSVDTWLIGYILIRFFGAESIDVEESEINQKAALAASYIALLELITKTILYYFHERVWNKIKWGKRKWWWLS